MASPFSKKFDMFPTDEIVICTYDDEVYKYFLTNENLNKPTFGRMILKTKCFDTYLPNIGELDYFDAVEEIKKVQEIIYCKMIEDFTQYFDLSVWIASTVSNHKSRVYPLPEHQYKLLKDMIEDLKRHYISSWETYDQTTRVGKHCTSASGP